MELYKLRYNLYNYLIKDNFDYNSCKEYLDLWKNSLIILFSFIILIFIAHFNELDLLSLIIILFILIFMYIIYYGIKEVIDKYESNKYLNDYNNYFNLINVMFLESYDFTEDNETNNPNYQDDSTIITNPNELINKTFVLTNTEENLEKYNAYIEDSRLYLKTNLDIIDLGSQLIEFHNSGISKNNNINDIFIQNSLIYNNLYYNQFNKDAKYSLTSNISDGECLTIKLDNNNNYDKRLLINTLLFQKSDIIKDDINNINKFIFKTISYYNDIDNNLLYLTDDFSSNTLKKAGLLSTISSYYYITYDINYLNLNKNTHIIELLTLNNNNNFIIYNNQTESGNTLCIFPDITITTEASIPEIIYNSKYKYKLKQKTTLTDSFINSLSLNGKIEAYIKNNANNINQKNILLNELINYYLKIIENEYRIFTKTNNILLSFSDLKTNKNNEKFITLFNNIILAENNFLKLNNIVTNYNPFNNTNIIRYQYNNYILNTDNINSNNIFTDTSKLFKKLKDNEPDSVRFHSIIDYRNNYYLKIKLQENNNIHQNYINSNIFNISNIIINSENHTVIKNTSNFIYNLKTPIDDYNNNNFIYSNCLTNINFINSIKTYINSSDSNLRIVTIDENENYKNIGGFRFANKIDYLYFYFNLSYLSNNSEKIKFLNEILQDINSINIEYIDNQFADNRKSILIYPNIHITYSKIKDLYIDKLIHFHHKIYNSFPSDFNENSIRILDTGYIISNPNITIRVLLNISHNKELSDIFSRDFKDDGVHIITDNIKTLFKGFVNYCINNIKNIDRPTKLLLNLKEVQDYKNENTIIKPLLDKIIIEEQEYNTQIQSYNNIIDLPNIIPKIKLYIKLNAANLQREFLNNYPKLNFIINNLIFNYNENNINKRKNIFMKEIYTPSHTDNINTYLASYFSLKKRIKQNIKYNDDKTDDEINNVEYLKISNNKDILKYIDIYNDKDLLFMKDFLFIRTDKNKTGNDFYDIIKGLNNRKLFLKHSDEIDTNDLIKKIEYPSNNTNTDYYLINMKAMHNLLESYDFGFMPKFVEYINEKYNLNVKNIDILYKIPDLNQNIEILKIVEDFNYEYIKIVIILIIIITIIMNAIYREYIRFIR